VIRHCVVCQRPLTGVEAHQRYCADRCREIARRYREAHRSPDADPFRADYGCVACGASLSDKQRSTRRFCSDNYRARFYYAMTPYREGDFTLSP
jgi:predicted nucleic acid-binding Zn ribbon protein